MLSKKFKESILTRELSKDDKLTNQPVDLSSKNSKDRKKLLTLDLKISNQDGSTSPVDFVLCEEDNHSDSSVEVLNEFRRSTSNDNLTSSVAGAYPLEPDDEPEDKPIYRDKIKELNELSTKQYCGTLDFSSILNETPNRSDDNLYSLPLNYETANSSSGINLPLVLPNSNQASSQTDTQSLNNNRRKIPVVEQIDLTDSTNTNLTHCFSNLTSTPRQLAGNSTRSSTASNIRIKKTARLNILNKINHNNTNNGQQTSLRNQAHRTHRPTSYETTSHTHSSSRNAFYPAQQILNPQSRYATFNSNTMYQLNQQQHQQQQQLLEQQLLEQQYQYQAAMNLAQLNSMQRPNYPYSNAINVQAANQVPTIPISQPQIFYGSLVATAPVLIQPVPTAQVAQTVPFNQSFGPTISSILNNSNQPTPLREQRRPTTLPPDTFNHLFTNNNQLLSNNNQLEANTQQSHTNIYPLGQYNPRLSPRSHQRSSSNTQNANQPTISNITATNYQEPRPSHIIHHMYNPNVTPPVLQSPSYVCPFINPNLGHRNFRTQNVLPLRPSSLNHRSPLNYYPMPLSLRYNLMQDFSYNQLQNLPIFNVFSGADKTTIKNHTTEYKYKKITKDFESKSKEDTIDEDDDSEKCVICLCDFEENDDVRRLQCLHLYHTSCIDKWLKMNKKCCVCRVDIDKSDFLTG